MKSYKIFFVFIVLLINTWPVDAQELILISDRSSDLKKVFESTFKAASTHDDFWLGYSIENNNGKKISVGSFHYSDYERITFRDFLYNTEKYIEHVSRSEDTKKRISGRSITMINGRIISDDGTDTESAILFRYDRNSTGINDFAEIAVCNFSHYVELESYPLYWLGKSDTKNSVDFVINLYSETGSWFAKEELLPAVGIHTDRIEVMPLLKGIINSNDEYELREDSVLWMGMQNRDEAFNILKNVINNDRSMDLREHAVMSLAYMDLPQVIDELIDIAKHNPNDELREQAIYGLGNKAVKKAEEALKDFVENDPDIEIKKRAVYALSNLEDDNIPYLIELAKTNPSLTLRKTAIWSLSSSDDERAVDALIELAGN